MNYIVTAASGPFGAHVVRSLLERRADARRVVATARDTSKLAALSALGVRTAELDYSRPETVAAVVTPGDVLVLVSGNELGRRVEQHTGVIAAAKAAGVSRIVYTSAPGATTSALILAPEHKATEEYLVASGVSATILRNGWYTENYAGEIEKAAATGEIVASVGAGRVASASRADFAEAAAVAALDDTLAGRTLELSGDHAWDFDELASTIGTLLDRPVAFRNLTPAAHAELFASFGLDEVTVGFIVGLDGNIRDGLLGGTSGDLARLLGRPTTPLAVGLAATLRPAP